MQTALESASLLALSQTLLSAGTLRRLVQQFGSAQAVWDAPVSQQGIWLKPKQQEKLAACQQSEAARLTAYQIYLDKGLQLLCETMPEYPAILRQTADAPFILHLRGSLAGLDQPTLAIVGTRASTDYGRRVVNALIEQLQPYRTCIVSGLAAGIDTVAHEAALHQGLPTIAVFGTAIDQVYPRQNIRLADAIVASGGACLSEYPPGAPADKFTFPKRNRIIAGLCQGTLVVEGALQSGALITAKVALEENRQVLAVPGSLFSPGSAGPHRLILDGAFPVTCGADIAEALNWECQASAEKSSEIVSKASVISPKHHSTEPQTAILPVTLAPDARRVLDNLSYEPLGFDDVQALHSDLPVSQLQTALTMLELDGLITALPGARFCRI